MKNLTVVTADPILTLELSNHYQVITEISENVFIDWLSPKENIGQITVLEEAIKNKSNVVIFDRYLTLKQHEVDWLLRYKNVHLFEPCLINRRYFQYMPFWYKVHSEFDIDDVIRDEIGIVPDINRINAGNDYNIPVFESHLGINMTILFCSKREYMVGYLPDMSEMLYNKCVPLLPGEHKYYWKLFQGLVVNNQKDLNWCINVLRLYDALIYGIYFTMERFFPEMLVENVAKQIKAAMGN